MSRVVVFAALIAGCGGVSQETHRDVVTQLRQARAQLDAERARSAKLARECRAAEARPPEPDPPEPAKPQFSQATPREAMESFIAAYRAERWDVIMRFVPNRMRDALTEDQLREELGGRKREEIERTLAAIEATGMEFAIEGNKAELEYGPGDEVELILEDDVWKIDDLD